MRKSSGIILDGEFVHGLIGAAKKGEYVSVKNNLDLSYEESAHNYLKNVSDSLYINRALEMLVIYENVYLADVFTGINIDKLITEGLVIKSDGFYENCEHHLNQLNNSKKGFLELNPLSLTMKKQAYPFIDSFITELMLTAGFQGREGKKRDTTEIGLQVARATSRAALLELENGDFWEALKASLLGSIDIFSEQAVEGIFDHLRKTPSFYNELQLWRMQAHFELEKTRILLELSNEKQIPFISSRFNEPAKMNGYDNTNDDCTPDTLGQAYKLCSISLLEEIRYMPKVEGIEDVLRLREDKRIIRFRQVLMEWSMEIKNGNAKIEKKIRNDVKRANNELKTLKKVEKVNRWMTYLGLPVSLIPVLSSITTVSSFLMQGYIDIKNAKYGWIGIGR